MPELDPGINFPVSVEGEINSKTRVIAEKYLTARSIREEIEFDTASRIDALPRRLIEIIYGWRFSRRMGITFSNRADFDNILPDLAKEVCPDFDN